MADGKLTITIDGDEAKAHAAYINLTKDQKDLVAEIGKMGIAAEAAADKSIKAAKAESTERKIQIRMADALVKSNETLTQAYDRQKQALDAALAAGTISAEQYKQTLDSLQKKVHEGSAEFQQASREKQEAAKLENAILNDQIKAATKILDATKSVTEKFNEQKAALEAAHAAGKITFEEYQKGLTHIKEQAAKANKELAEGEQNTEQGFGKKAQEQVVAFGAKFIAAAGSVKVISDALALVSREREKALNIGSELSVARRDLRGLSGDFAELESRADKISMATGVGRAAARGIVFTGESQQVSASDQMLAAQVSKFADPNVAIAFMADMGDQFAKEKLTGEQSLNIALTAADLSKFNPSDLLPQIQKAAIGAKVGGMSSVDTAAITGALASSFGQETGTRVSALFSKMAASDQFKGMDGVEALRKMRGMSEEELAEFTGSDQTMIGTLAVALQSMDGPKGIEAARRKIAEQKLAAGTEKSFTQAKIARTFDVSTREGNIAALERARDIEKVRGEIDVENKQLQPAMERQIRQEEVDRAARGMREKASPALGGPDNFLNRWMQSFVFSGFAKADELQADLRGTDPGIFHPQITVPEKDLPITKSQPASTGKKRVMFDTDGRNVLVEEGSQEEAEIMARQRELGRRRSEAEFKTAEPDSALVVPAKEQVSKKEAEKIAKAEKVKAEKLAKLEEQRQRKEEREFNEQVELAEKLSHSTSAISRDFEKKKKALELGLESGRISEEDYRHGLREINQRREDEERKIEKERAPVFQQSEEELKRQTSAIDRQTSTLVAAMQEQARALTDISEKLNFQAV